MNKLPTYFVTGGAGFIGSALCRHLIMNQLAKVVNIDKLTYAANPEALAAVENSPLYVFEKIDICDLPSLKKLFSHYQPDGVFHLAAESHVDNSITGAAAFMQTNVIGTFNLLEATRHYYAACKKHRFRFLHVSTDEVYGSLSYDQEEAFTESTPYNPSSPYSASKASSDHLVNAWHKTYQLPTLITNCSNNYGPYQHPEKLIPLVIQNALKHKPIPIYGDGKQVRDWLHVNDHISALLTIFQKGTIGGTYNIGGNNELENLELVKLICEILDTHYPATAPKGGHQTLISFVKDRPGHDVRYAVNSAKLMKQLEWTCKSNFKESLSSLVNFYYQKVSQNT